MALVHTASSSLLAVEMAVLYTEAFICYRSVHGLRYRFAQALWCLNFGFGCVRALRGRAVSTAPPPLAGSSSSSSDTTAAAIVTTSHSGGAATVFKRERGALPKPRAAAEIKKGSTSFGVEHELHATSATGLSGRPPLASLASLFSVLSPVFLACFEFFLSFSSCAFISLSPPSEMLAYTV